MNIDLINQIKLKIATKKNEIKQLEKMLIDLVVGDTEPSIDSPIATSVTMQSSTQPAINLQQVAANDALRNAGIEIGRKKVKMDGQDREIVEEWIGGSRHLANAYNDQEMGEI